MVVTKGNSGGALGYRSADETAETIARLTGQPGAAAERGGPPKPGGKKDGRLAGNEGGKGKTLKTPSAKKGGKGKGKGMK